ncbi:MAG: cation diffusion facilitator family transporter [Anaerolineaceae bacterium]|nr:cation diffusion facilitator family transporter [Anaerolineaceae bacterium]HNX46075.1 cation diffusion facilitator family transporter [Anaerolineaceae bacterium]HPT24156.1 cation diffusion facilitator family transporter [Anaerolineaceae bacterium]
MSNTTQVVEEERLEHVEKIDPVLRTRLSNRAVGLTLISNIFLAIIKTAIGIVGHSPALLADGINSTSDVVYNIVVSVFVRAAHKPADDEHPYGHTQFESVGALVVGAFVITTAITIFWNAINSLFDFINGTSDFSGSMTFTIYIALFTVLLKTLLSVYTHKVGERTNNPSIIALARDHRNDIFSASAVVIGIFLSLRGYLWVDPLAGAIVALVILRTGIGILRDSTDDLMDTIPGKALEVKITELLATIPGVEGIDSTQAHRFGQYLVINVAIFVDGNISVDAGDRIADVVESQLIQEIDYVRAVHVHYHSHEHAIVHPAGGSVE